MVALRGLHIQAHTATLTEALGVVLDGAHIPALVQGALREAVDLHQLVVVCRRALLVALHTQHRTIVPSVSDQYNTQCTTYAHLSRAVTGTSGEAVMLKTHTTRDGADG